VVSAFSVVRIFKEIILKIKMLTTQSGSPDGRTVCSYIKDEQYDLPESLGKVFVKEGWAKKVQAKAPKQVVRKKDRGQPPENKQR
jgi:hypothetical protein